MVRNVFGTPRSLSLALMLVLLMPIGSLGSSAGSVSTADSIDLDVADRGDDSTCRPEYVRGVGDACRTPDGLLRVTLDDGLVLTTHGADPDPGDADEPVTPGAGRQPVCAGDWYQHVLYAHPQNKASRYSSQVGTIRNAISNMNNVLNLDALASGDVTADYKVLCDANLDIRVDEVMVPSSSGDFSVIVNAVRAAGYSSGRADYSIFYDGSETGLCGVGNFAADESPSVGNANNRGGDYAVTYVGCWNGRTPMHENGHNQGAVQRTAPDSDLSGHCLEGRDIMCYPTSSILVLCPGRYRFDCDYDTYFDAEPEPGEWLATHWNIGSRVNRFIVFDGANVVSDPITDFTVEVDGWNVTVDASATYDPDGHNLSLLWDFGDGAQATGTTATHSYAEAGRFDITLNATDDGGGESFLTREVFLAPVITPHVETFGFTGTIACAVAFGPLGSVDHCDAGSGDYYFELDAGATGARVILYWNENHSGGDGSLGTDEMRYQWIVPGMLGSRSGTTPVTAVHEFETETDLYLQGGTASLTVRTDGDSGLVLEQEYHLCIDILYGGEPVPSGFTC